MRFVSVPETIKKKLKQKSERFAETLVLLRSTTRLALTKGMAMWLLDVHSDMDASGLCRQRVWWLLHAGCTPPVAVGCTQ